MEKAPVFKKDSKSLDLIVELQDDLIFKKIQDEYYFWDKVKFLKHKHSSEKLWNAVKYLRFLRSETIKFGTHSFSFMITDYMQKTIHQFDMNIGGILGSNINIAETDKKKFLLNSIMEEAISSSQMEGANTTRKIAKEMIRLEKKPTNTSEQMILNNFETMKYIVKNKNEDITPEKILSIQRLIAKNTLDSSADEGSFRRNDEVHVVNFVKGEIVHIPPNNEEIKILINDLCNFFNNESAKFIHPIIKGCIIHFMIGWIHPFTDGNGRTARALFYWFMLKNGYWLTEYLSISRIIKNSKTQYEKAYLYSEIDENDLGYFITYHLKTMKKAFDDLNIYLNLKQNEVFQAAQFMKIPNVNERMAQILKIINDDSERILTSKTIENRFQISNFTARSDLKSLVSLGFLEVVKVNKKKQNFIKSSNFDEILKNI